MAKTADQKKVQMKEVRYFGLITCLYMAVYFLLYFVLIIAEAMFDVHPYVHLAFLILLLPAAKFVVEKVVEIPLVDEYLNR